MKSLALRIYRRLTLAFPHEFQMVYGADVIHLGEEAIDDIWTQQGFIGLVRLIVDIAILALAAIGLAGVTAYPVARRRKEIGIRMALGAPKGQVLRLVLREGGSMVCIGSALGLLGAFAASRALAASSILGPIFAANSRDPRLVFGAPLLLAGLAMLACYIPARRSAKIDPLIALREE